MGMMIDLVSKHIKRVALYARVSTKLKPRELLSELDKKNWQDTENQLVQLREYCFRQGLEVVGEYVDRASGKISDREEFKRLFQDAYQHKFDLVLFWSLDRFSREGVLETLQHLQKLTSYKVEWKSYTEPYLDSLGVFRDAVLAILATIAKQERIRLVERTVAGLEIARAKGKVFGRRRIITRLDKIVEMKKAGMSIRKIAAELEIDKGIVERRWKDYEKQNITDNDEVILP